MSKEYTRAGRKFVIETYPKPTVDGVTTFTQAEYSYILDSGFTNEHFNFLCDQKGRDFRYEFVPDPSDLKKEMALKQSQEIIDLLKGNKENKLDF